MASDDLIAAYVAELTRRLPAGVLDELIDGLLETRDRFARQGLAPTAAASAAITEFGHPDDVVAAFVRESPSRRHAVRLLATAPIFAGLWGTALISSQAWTWPVPRPVEIAYGALLLAVAGTLFGVVAARRPGQNRPAAHAGTVLVLLDAAMVIVVLLVAPALTWLMVPALVASIIRIAVVAPRLPRLLSVP